MEKEVCVGPIELGQSTRSVSICFFLARDRVVSLGLIARRRAAGRNGGPPFQSKRRNEKLAGGSRERNTGQHVRPLRHLGGLPSTESCGGGTQKKRGGGTPSTIAPSARLTSGAIFFFFLVRSLLFFLVRWVVLARCALFCVLPWAFFFFRRECVVTTRSAKKGFPLCIDYQSLSRGGGKEGRGGGRNFVGVDHRRYSPREGGHTAGCLLLAPLFSGLVVVVLAPFPRRVRVSSFCLSLPFPRNIRVACLLFCACLRGSAKGGPRKIRRK